MTCPDNRMAFSYASEWLSKERNYLPSYEYPLEDQLLRSTTTHSTLKAQFPVLSLQISSEKGQMSITQSGSNSNDRMTMS
jgi:hypothetical protein